MSYVPYQSMPYQPTNNNQLTNPYYNQAQSALERLEKLQNQQQNMNMSMGMNSQSQAQPQMASTNVNWVQVGNIQQAKEQIVQPNMTIWMMDSYLPKIYVKSVSNVGKIEFQPYELVPLDENGNRINNLQEVKENEISNNVQYVPIEDFNNLSEVVKQLKEKVTMYEGMLLNTKETKTSSSTVTKRGGNSSESTK